jgi:isoleucyl-tRNA synthetase
VTKYEERIDEMHQRSQEEIENYIISVFNSQIKPWLQKYHLTFVAGMGDYYIEYTDQTPKWFVQKYKDTYWMNQPKIDKDLIDSRIRNILESSSDALNGYAIGSWMPSYP